MTGVAIVSRREVLRTAVLRTAVLCTAVLCTAVLRSVSSTGALGLPVCSKLPGGRCR